MPRAKTYRFPIGGGRVISVTSPFKGERPFSDSLERCLTGLASLVGKLSFGSTSTATPPGGARLDFEKTLYGFPSEEMVACSYHGYRPNMMLLHGVAIWRSFASSSQYFAIHNGGGEASTGRPVYISCQLSMSTTAIEDTPKARVFDNDDIGYAIAVYNDNDGPVWGVISNFIVMVAAHSLRVDNHQVVECLAL